MDFMKNEERISAAVTVFGLSILQKDQRYGKKCFDVGNVQNKSVQRKHRLTYLLLQVLLTVGSDGTNDVRVK